MVKVQYAPNDKLDLKKRQTQGGQYDAPPPPNGKTWNQLHNHMKTKPKQNSTKGSYN